MKKILLTIVSALFLVGCTEINNVPDTKHINTYKNQAFNISFQYPLNWEVVDKQIVKQLVENKVISEEKKFDHSVLLKTGNNENIFFDYDSMSFDKYETYKQPKKLANDAINKFEIEKITMTNYPAKKYTEYGIELAGISYIIEKDGRFLMFETESGLTEEQKVGVEQIVNSIEFK